MPVYSLDGVAPKIHPTVWLAPDAVVIGNVELAEGANVWFGAVLRGDNEPIRIGARSNIQESAVVHADPGYPVTVGDDVTVGHQVMLHGCTIEDAVLVGIQAVVLNGARIGSGSLVGAGALVTERSAFEAGVLLLGSPAKVARALGPEQLDRHRAIAANYAERAARYRRGLKRID
jgi:carbonic anhydrase/acetyltransferase-like protein (isoleucine patch superfamily)